MRNFEIAASSPSETGRDRLTAIALYAMPALAVNGAASVFESSLIVELRDASGTPLVTQVITADAAGPATGRWSTTLDLATVVAGAYELVAYDISARDGTPENVFAIPIRITV